MASPDGFVTHAEMQIGDSVLMLADENLESGSGSPERYPGSPVSVFLYVPDVDSTFATAIAVGAKSQVKPTDMCWGDRLSVLTDPFGHRWLLATRIEEIPPEEIARRVSARA